MTKSNEIKVEANRATAASRRAKLRKQRDRMMADLGFIKVKGALSGRTYYE